MRLLRGVKISNYMGCMFTLNSYVYKGNGFNYRWLFLYFMLQDNGSRLQDSVNENMKLSRSSMKMLYQISLDKIGRHFLAFVGSWKTLILL